MSDIDARIEADLLRVDADNDDPRRVVSLSWHESELEWALAELKRAREALKKVAAEKPKNYKPDREHWEWGNFDDSYSYGRDAASYELAQIAILALKSPTEEGKALDGGNA